MTVDEDEVNEAGKIIESEKKASYIAKSRAIYQVIYAHPPEYDLLDSGFDNHDLNMNRFGLLLSRNGMKTSFSYLLERILIWHQDLHFGKGPMDAKKIEELIKDYKYRYDGILRVKCFKFLFISLISLN